MGVRLVSIGVLILAGAMLADILRSPNSLPLASALINGWQGSVNTVAGK